MLFSSYEFLLLFIPLTLAGFAVCRVRSIAAGQAWLLAASAGFYGWWNPSYLGLLLGSIGVNFVLGRLLGRLPLRSTAAGCVLTVGVVLNLGLLGWFKYAGFLVENAARLTGANWSLDPIVLPLAISFFTFQQLAFLVDAWRDRRPTGTLVEYALFVLFFPQLIAGPIVQHGDVIDQFRDEARFRLRWDFAAVGIAVFVVGLFKKVAVADGLAPAANAVFDAAATGTPLSMADAWLGTLAYALQLYFDFSGYSDMAIGLGWLFGVRLATNFAAPYQASSLSEFWRRWHITLSHFLRDYLYIPLGGSRCGTWRRSINLFLTMLLGGIWHGAGWTFVVWGALHGGLLIVNHSWSQLARNRCWTWTASRSWTAASRALTLLAVLLGWVVFRAADLNSAGRMLAGLAGLSEANAALPGVRELLRPVLLLTAAVLWLPTTQTLVPDPERAAPACPAWVDRLVWRPTLWHGIACSAALLACVTLLTRVKEFLYFQF